MPVENPWDHNVECKYCDEQAAHAADCSWLVQLEARVPALEEELVKANLKVEAFREQVTALECKAAYLEPFKAQVARQEEVILNQVRSIGGLRAAFDAATKEAGEATEAAKDFAAKIQFLIDWADQVAGGDLLEEHRFTFPDGDTWEAGKR